MKNKAKQSQHSDLPVKLHNHLVRLFNERMEAKGIKKESEAWFEAQALFFTAVLAVYDILEDGYRWEDHYVRHQLEYQSKICEIILLPRPLKTLSNQ